jgi:RND family efflux transporter MFP subunit
MKAPFVNRRTLILIMVLLPLSLVFGFVATRSGPLAPILVTVAKVERQSITPSLFGIGIVEVKYRYRVGPTLTGRLLRLDSDVGDSVTAGQVLGEMDPVDMDDKISANQAAVERAAASVAAAEARLKDFAARVKYAQAQAKRYKHLVTERNVSKEAAEEKYQEHQVAKAGLAAAQAELKAARQEQVMLRAEYKGLLQQRSNLRLIAPSDGVVVGRYIEPGSTAVAGQTVVEIIDPRSIWINVRFNQLQSDGLAKGLPATIILRSHPDQPLAGKVARVELLADSVTEETLAKVSFNQLPEPFPPLGELAEVTLHLPQLDATLVAPNASIKSVNGHRGVWLVENDSLRFTPVEIGASDLDGRVQILRGLEPGDRIVLYSKQELTANSRIKITDQLMEGG